MKSHLTAISRKTLPVPIHWLVKIGLVHGNVLDFGCGKCKKLNDHILANIPGITSVFSYDPHFQPIFPPQREFDVVLCTYVLCVLPQYEQNTILTNIQLFLKDSGVAYITVRNDKPKHGYGMSSRNTFQRKVEIPFLHLFRNTPSYNIYLMTKYSVIG